MASQLLIVIDTREQTPWTFPEGYARVRFEKLDAGDYALDGDCSFAVERKSLNDFIGTITSDWARFMRQWDRCLHWPAKVVIVECNAADIIARKYRSSVLPKFVFKRVAELTLMGVAVVFAGNAVAAAGICYSILRERERQRGLTATTDCGADDGIESPLPQGG